MILTEFAYFDSHYENQEEHINDMIKRILSYSQDTEIGKWCKENDKKIYSIVTKKAHIFSNEKEPMTLCSIVADVSPEEETFLILKFPKLNNSSYWYSGFSGYNSI
jgi:hypothetical protein